MARKICKKCGHEIDAHYRMVDDDGELIYPEPCPCLECGCTAEMDKKKEA